MRWLSADPVRRRSVLVAGLAAAAFYLFHSRVHAPRVERTDALAARTLEMRERNRRAEAVAAAGAGGIEERLARYERHIARLETLIPGGGEVAQLLEAVSREERRAGVEMTMMRPLPRVAGEFYEQWSYELAVQGGYHEVGAFLAGVASLERIVVPDNVVVAALPGAEARSDVLATLEIRAYVALSPAPGPESAADDAPSGAQSAARLAPSRRLLRPALGPAPPVGGVARFRAVAASLSESQEPQSPRSAAETPAPLVFERELFRYPVAGRRNPFAVPGGQRAAQPAPGRFRLLGLIAGDGGDPGFGVAVLARAPTAAAVAERRSFRLRIGEKNGAVRLMEIVEGGVRVEIEGPGGVVVQTLALPRPRPPSPS